MSARKLQELLLAAGYAPGSYSGRGMYGAECLSVALSGSRVRAYAAAAHLARDLKRIARRGEGATITRAVATASCESLGQGVVFYWPSVPFAQEIVASGKSRGES